MDLEYARVSTAKQDLDRQVDALHQAGIAPERIYLHKKSGATTDRPGLKAALEYALNGDVIVVDTLVHRLGDYHAFVTDRDLPLPVEADHRRHAVVEQAIAELKSAGWRTCPPASPPPPVDPSAWPLCFAPASRPTCAATADHRNPTNTLAGFPVMLGGLAAEAMGVRRRRQRRAGSCAEAGYRMLRRRWGRRVLPRIAVVLIPVTLGTLALSVRADAPRAGPRCGSASPWASGSTPRTPCRITSSAGRPGRRMGQSRPFPRPPGC